MGTRWIARTRWTESTAYRAVTHDRPRPRYHESADDVPDGLAIAHWSWDGLVVAAD
ncbi:MAG TPA: hypothetical protein VFJ19_04495 [Nocardioidaceae bacterium]|nr:hypothetical protein [Nocardioidaceae bacterium]